MKILSAHQPQFIPWLGFFSKIKSCDEYVVLDNLKYSDLSFQTRNKIKNISTKSWTWLIIPVARKTTHKLFSNVLIDPNNKIWKLKHLKSIYQSYNKTKFFNEVYVDIENIYKSEEINLSKFIFNFIEYALKIFKIDTKIHFQSCLETKGLINLKQKSELLLEITKFLKCDCFLFGANADKYFFLENKNLFKDNNIRFLFQKFNHPIYQQMHNKNFLPNLSFLDLLFNCGKVEACKILQKTQ
jgi:hypothetical protein